MPKKVKPVVPVTNRKTLSRREREERYRRWLYIGGAAVLALIFGLLAFGFIQQWVIAPATPIATVNGTPIRLDTYQRWVRYRRYDMDNYIQSMKLQMGQIDSEDEGQKFLYDYMEQQISQLQMQRASLPMTVLDELIDSQLIRQEAQRRGITVSADEVQKEIQSQFGYDPNPVTPTPAAPVTATATVTGTPQPTATPGPTPTRMSEEQFKQYYEAVLQEMLSAAGFTEADFRSLVETMVLRNKLQEAMAAEVPTSAEQVHARHILVEKEEEAKAALERINKGEDFAAVAKELSTDTSNSEEGGDLGWFMRGQMVSEFEEAAFALQPNQISDPVQTSYGYHIIQVLEREDNRPLDETQLAQKRAGVLDEWLTAQRQSDAVKRYWSSDKVPVDRS